ncbi:MAG: response regulator [Phycisphaerales bacterium]|nr:MAG: response regulator [Phycisphaerales bacterium]
MSRPLNALIVDDSTTTRKMIIRALEQTGLAEFSFTEAEDGIDALGKYRPGDTEAVFVDMNMPRMGGLEFIRELRSKHKKCPPLVMITAESSRELLAQAINESKVDAFLLKPVNRDRLQAGLRKLVDSIPERSGPCIVPHGECVRQAVQDVLAQACDLGLSVEEVEEAVPSGEVVLAMITLHGGVNWSVLLGFTRESAKAAASRFAGYEVPSDGPDMADAVGEIANIVGGRIKQLLSAKGLAASLSLPTVLGASGFEVLLQHKSTVNYVHFDSPAGRMWTMVAVGMDAGMIL